MFEFIFDDSVLLPGLQQSFSRGSVHISSPSPFVPPAIDQRYLSNPLDLLIFAQGFLYTRHVMHTHAIQDINGTETFPGEEAVPSPDMSKIETSVRQGVTTLNHHAGTAAMLPREWGGVVDAQLKVYGVEGLRVVDASIIPVLPAAHLQDTVYAVAERAADLIKESQ
jgi:choline dehydrogenase-like flavoprotein